LKAIAATLPLRARRTSLHRASASLEQQLERLTEAYMGGVIRLEEYARRRRELEEKMEAFKSQERELGQQVERRASSFLSLADKLFTI
jgi:site-specific DNA recombinase